MNTKLVLVMAVLLLGQTCPAQQRSADSVEVYLQRLRNDAVTVINNRFDVQGMNHDAAGLYHHADKKVVIGLEKLLADSSKTLACHVLLTLLLEPTQSGVQETSEDLTEQILFQYRCNGLGWEMLYNKTNLTTVIRVDAAEIKKVQLYWKEKIPAPLQIMATQH